MNNNRFCWLVIVALGVGLHADSAANMAAAQTGQAPVVPRPVNQLEELPPPIESAGQPVIRNETRVSSAAAVRIKDITRVQGYRTNKLIGMGLVAGLQGTGGKNPATRQFALNMLERLGNRADPIQRAAIRLDALDKTDNLSVVAVSAEVDVSRHRQGNRIDVIVSAFDNATSLQGGVLIMTPLKGVDGEVYALADGPVSIGGFSFSGDAASVQKNHPTTGRIPGGATIEKDICLDPVKIRDWFGMNLLNPDLETASRIVNAINKYWMDHAQLVDGGSVQVSVPAEYRRNPNHFIALVQSIRVVPDIEARVVINERTGTVVIGDDVRLKRVAITHANLSVITGESPQVSQPAPFSPGVTTVVPRTDIEVVEDKGLVNVIDQPVTVGDLARALNALGVTPRDLSAIFQQLKASGALQAKLEFN